MQDLFYLMVAVGFFALAAGYTLWLRKLQPENGDE